MYILVIERDHNILTQTPIGEYIMTKITVEVAQILAKAKVEVVSETVVKGERGPKVTFYRAGLNLY